MARKNNSLLVPALLTAYVAGVMTPSILESLGGERDPSQQEKSPADTIAVGKFVVDSVIDGDTLKVKDPRATKGIAVIRILGMNAPESRPNRGRPVQCYSKEAFDEANKLKGREVELSIDPQADTQDDDNRFLRMVDTDPGKDVDNFSEHMVKQGFAAAYRRYVTSIRTDLINLEEDARRHKRGMWDVCNISPTTIPTNLSSEVAFPPAK